MMITAIIVVTLNHWSAAEFAAPNDKRVVEHAALLEIFNQRGAGLVGVLTILLDVLHQVSVLVPGLVKELNESHAAFHQTAREQAVIGEGRSSGLSAVHL